MGRLAPSAAHDFSKRESSGPERCERLISSTVSAVEEAHCRAAGEERAIGRHADEVSRGRDVAGA
jgi:hypothetical protein